MDDCDGSGSSGDECEYDMLRRKRIAENQRMLDKLMKDVLPLEVLKYVHVSIVFILILIMFVESLTIQSCSQEVKNFSYTTSQEGKSI